MDAVLPSSGFGPSACRATVSPFVAPVTGQLQGIPGAGGSVASRIRTLIERRSLLQETRSRMATMID
jgi:hypothetical protein